MENRNFESFSGATDAHRQAHLCSGGCAARWLYHRASLRAHQNRPLVSAQDEEHHGPREASADVYPGRERHATGGHEESQAAGLL